MIALVAGTKERVNIDGNIEITIPTGWNCDFNVAKFFVQHLVHVGRISIQH